jgi:hypothetical protein
VVGQQEQTMNDHPGVRLSDQVGVGGAARGAEVVSWGSPDALEAVKRICQGVALRCHQAIATHPPGDTPDIPVSAAS